MCACMCVHFFQFFSLTKLPVIQLLLYSGDIVIQRPLSIIVGVGVSSYLFFFFLSCYLLKILTMAIKFQNINPWDRWRILSSWGYDISTRKVVSCFMAASSEAWMLLVGGWSCTLCVQTAISMPQHQVAIWTWTLSWLLKNFLYRCCVTNASQLSDWLIKKSQWRGRGDSRRLLFPVQGRGRFQVEQERGREVKVTRQWDGWAARESWATRTKMEPEWTGRD